ncbi:MAG: hypothetical protein L0271_22875 [Gemmatimonadetes bacterium]|nr:hypothetical protein [Gemmatimonadota bacterium]
MSREDDRFTDPLQRAARDLGEPPEPRREAIWARIDERRRDSRQVRPMSASRRWWWPGLGLAAALAAGILIGRLALPIAGSPPASPGLTAGAPTGADGPFRLLATHHLVRTEALLTTFPIDAQEGRTREVARWAYDLLLDTRVLMESPAGADPRLGALLTDLELILAQLATLRPDDAATELILIQEGIDQNDVIERLRTETTLATGEGM